MQQQQTCPQQKQEIEKKPYTAPEVTALGSVEQVTECCWDSGSSLRIPE